jgi:hypothetical protein
MKKTIIAFSLLTFSISTFAQAQDKPVEVNYRRSSLHTILLESDKFPKKAIVINAYNSYPFPDKYNEHFKDDATGKNTAAKSFDPKKITLTDADRSTAGQKNSEASKFAKGMASQATGGLIDSTAKDIPLQINKYINESQLAKQMVKKWYNVKSDGGIDFELLKKRGCYSVSEKTKDALKNTSKGTLEDLMAKDTGLVSNSFVVFNKLNFIENEPVARAIREGAKIAATEKIKQPMLLEKALQAADLAYEKGKEGYSVWTTSWLYKLAWSENLSSYVKMINNLPTEKERLSAWDTATVFKLVLIGSENSQSLVTFSLNEKRTEEQIIKLALTRNIDNVYAKLQKEYDVFKPIIRVDNVGPITAKIGLKEGLTKKSKFELLNLEGTEFKKVGTISVNSKFPIWDNRFGADIEQKIDSLTGKPIVTPEWTTFKGGKKAEKGFTYMRLKK